MSSTRRAPRRAIQEHALRLFPTKGHDETTVEEIAAAATAELITALTAWVDGDGDEDLRTLVDQAFAALGTGS